MLRRDKGFSKAESHHMATNPLTPVDSSKSCRRKRGVFFQYVLLQYNNIIQKRGINYSAS